MSPRKRHPANRIKPKGIKHADPQEIKRIFLKNPNIQPVEIARLLGVTGPEVNRVLNQLRKKDPSVKKRSEIIKAKKQAERDAAKTHLIELIQSGKASGQTKTANLMGTSPGSLTRLLKEIIATGSPAEKRIAQDFLRRTSAQPTEHVSDTRYSMLKKEHKAAGRKYSRQSKERLFKICSALEKRIEKTKPGEKRDLLQMRLNAARAVLQQRAKR